MLTRSWCSSSRGPRREGLLQWHAALLLPSTTVLYDYLYRLVAGRLP
jgi:hypothetical protein